MTEINTTTTVVYTTKVDAQALLAPTVIPEAIERMADERYKVVPSHKSMFHRWAVVAGGTQQLYLGREVECQNMARKFAGAFLDGVYVVLRNAAPQPSPTAPATQQPEGDVVAYLDVGANGYLDLGSELSEDALQQLPKGRHALVIAGTYGIDGYVAAPQPSYTAQAADSVPAVGYPPLPRVGAIGYASVVDIDSYAKTLTIGPHLPGVRDIALWTTDQMRAYVDADRAARDPADSVKEDAAQRKSHAD